MSRESDIQALKQLKNDLNEASAYADLAKEEWDKSRAIKQEMETTTFVFKPLPTNNYQTTKEKFKNSWKETFRKTGKFKIVFLVLYSLLMAAFAAGLAYASFKNEAGFFFVKPHEWSDTSELVLTAVSMAAFPVVTAIFSWVHIVSSGNRGSFIKKSLIALIITGIFFGSICGMTNSIHLLIFDLASLVAIIVLCFIVQLICLIISNFPVYGVKKRAILAEEKQKDIENTELNRINEVKEREEWEAWWAKRKPELKEIGLDHISRGDAAMEKAKEHLANAYASDILGEDEKDSGIIDMLIHFIESHRADNIKEALHEYDIMKQNQKLLEIEAIKVNLEIEKAKKENADRMYEMEMNRRHQIEMEAQARRNADMQSQIAANTAAAAASAERMRKDAASAAADAAATQARIAADMNAIRLNEYYNS